MYVCMDVRSLFNLNRPSDQNTSGSSSHVVKRLGELQGLHVNEQDE